MTDFQLEQQCDALARKGCSFWPEIADMEKHAQSVQTKRYIHDTAVSLYHREEAACGLL